MSHTIFNIVVDTVVQDMFLDICDPQEAHHGLGWVEGEQYIVFYADYVHIVRRNPIWLQSTLMTLMRIFERVGPYTNLGNNKAMTCTPGFI